MSKETGTKETGSQATGSSKTVLSRIKEWAAPTLAILSILALSYGAARQVINWELQDVEGRVSSLETAVSRLEADIGRVEIDINDLKTELKADINNLETELKADIGKLSDMLFTYIFPTANPSSAETSLVAEDAEQPFFWSWSHIENSIMTDTA